VRILIVDDDPGLRRSLSLLLDAEGYRVAAEGEPAHGLERALRESFDIILCDVRMPEIDGLTFLRRFREGGGGALLIMMSAYGGEDAAIEAMKEGAYDYVPKPFRSDELLLTLRKAEERERLRGRIATLEAELARWTGADLVADSPAMRKVMDLAARVAPHTTTVLITGESGTGKEVLARTIHRMSPRRAAPFVAVNCGAIPENLLESELFGHAKGAFTGATSHKPGLFEEAHGGTLLLDEVGELPLTLQVKLLRALQEGEIRRVGESAARKVDTRLLAATARNLEEDARDGRFREDLLYRLNVVNIHIPPLRQRPEDLDGLVTSLLARVSAKSSREVRIMPAALEAIRQRSWPGNVRELENALERAAVLSSDGDIGPDAFEGIGAPVGARPGAPTHAGAVGATPPDLKSAVRVAERQAIEAALGATGGNRKEAADLLGVSLRTLFYKLKDFGIE
jgi:two-component system response regulator AtoC